MIYLGTRMVGPSSRSEDSNHLLEAQVQNVNVKFTSMFEFSKKSLKEVIKGKKVKYCCYYSRKLQTIN